LIRFGALPPKHELSEPSHRRQPNAIPSCLSENPLYIDRASDERLGIADGEGEGNPLAFHHHRAGQADWRRELEYGVLAERWLFFVEAKHSVTLYYGRDL